MFNFARQGLPGVVALMALLLLSGCDFTEEQASRRRKFDDVGEIDVYGRETIYSYGGKQVQNGRLQNDAQYAGRKHAHEVGEIRIDDESDVKRVVPNARLEMVHPSVSVQPLNAPAPRAAPEYRTSRS
jgi:hypothetical protein